MQGKGQHACVCATRGSQQQGPLPAHARHLAEANSGKEIQGEWEGSTSDTAFAASLSSDHDLFLLNRGQTSRRLNPSSFDNE
eukprot:1158960-Pelagomonas_calceolata.AAC.3